MPALCRDCLAQFDQSSRCPRCRSPRVLAHDELFDLSIAHMDCDAFYASVEKRENPDLANKPVIIGGGERGVVSTACYIARIRGVHSAMPMFQALKRCPDAVVLPPRMELYAEVSRQIRAMMLALTPDIEPLSLDEAFLDLSGTARVHQAPPAVVLSKLILRMRDELGLTGSIGLSHNKFLAKLASDMDKPHGFSVIGKAETLDRLAPMPVSRIWGVGRSLQETLHGAGIHTFADLRRWEQSDLVARFGSSGLRLWHLSRGEDHRRVSANTPVKSISKETTFSKDTADITTLDGHIWRLSQQVSDRAKARDLAGQVVTLKLKRADHSQLTRRRSLTDATQLADRIYHTARDLLDAVPPESPYRLIGVGISNLVPAADSDREGDLLDPGAARRTRAERATDDIRRRFGSKAIIKGRSLN